MKKERRQRDIERERKIVIQEGKKDIEGEKVREIKKERKLEK